MTRDSHLVLVGDRNDALEEIGDALTVSIVGDSAGLGQRRIRLGLGELEVCIHTVASTWFAASAQHAENAHVVLDARDSGGSAVLDHRLHAFNLSTALRALAEHDAGI